MFIDGEQIEIGGLTYNIYVRDEELFQFHLKRGKLKIELKVSPTSSTYYDLLTVKAKVRSKSAYSFKECS
jgi:hypothetical protein